MIEAMYRRPVKDGCEIDALTDEHHYFIFRAGKRKRVKIAHNRRVRRTSRQRGWDDRD
jgi:hypothetical protein